MRLECEFMTKGAFSIANMRYIGLRNGITKHVLNELVLTCLSEYIVDYLGATLYDFAEIVFGPVSHLATKSNCRAIKIIQKHGQLYFGRFWPTEDCQYIDAKDLDDVPILYRDHFISESDWYLIDNEDLERDADQDGYYVRERAQDGSLQVYAWIYTCLRDFWRRQQLSYAEFAPHF
jgi:hypothetical protein